MQLTVITSILLCLAITVANAIVCPKMKTAATFAVVAGAGMTNTGLSVITGKVALSPTPALTGFPPGVISGAIDYNNAVAIQAETDCTSAYTYCQGEPFTTDLTGIDLGGKTLTAGTYKFSSTAGIAAASNLTLNGPGVYIFQIGSAITTGANTRVLLENGALAGCVYWQVGSSATFGASSIFLGNVLAYASATFGNAVTYDGTVCAHTGDVTLINDNIHHEPRCTC
jgi:type VI secretion system secreted protein VgrG